MIQTVLNEEKRGMRRKEGRGERRAEESEKMNKAQQANDSSGRP